MTHFTTRRTFAAAIVAGAVMPTARVVSALDTSTPVDHEAHHAATPTVAAASDTGMTGTPTAGTMMPMGDFDLMFIDMMTPHHEGAIAMSEVAVARAEHPELGELAQQIIESQQFEHEQMQAWRQEWYPDDPFISMGDVMDGIPGMEDMTGMMGMGMMDPETMADQMRNASEPFDIAFINAMLPHHIMALMGAELAVQQAVHPELAKLAQGMVGKQAKEISQMNGWRSEWEAAEATPLASYVSL